MGELRTSRLCVLQIRSGVTGGCELGSRGLRGRWGRGGEAGLVALRRLVTPGGMRWAAGALQVLGVRRSVRPRREGARGVGWGSAYGAGAVVRIGGPTGGVLRRVGGLCACNGAGAGGLASSAPSRRRKSIEEA